MLSPIHWNGCGSRNLICDEKNAGTRMNFYNELHSLHCRLQAWVLSIVGFPNLWLWKERGIREGKKALLAVFWLSGGWLGMPNIDCIRLGSKVTPIYETTSKPNCGRHKQPGILISRLLLRIMDWHVWSQEWMERIERNLITRSDLLSREIHAKHQHQSH